MKKRKELFQNWIEEQSVFQDVDLSQMSFYLRKQAFDRLRKMYERQYNDLQTLSVFFGLQHGCQWSESGTAFSEQDAKKHFAKLYSLLQGDIEEFINYLKEHAKPNERLKSLCCFSSSRLSPCQLYFTIYGIQC